MHIQFVLASAVLLNNFTLSNTSFQVMNLLLYVARVYNFDYNKHVANYKLTKRFIGLEYKYYQGYFIVQSLLAGQISIF